MGEPRIRASGQCHQSSTNSNNFNWWPPLFDGTTIKNSRKFTFDEKRRFCDNFLSELIKLFDREITRNECEVKKVQSERSKSVSENRLKIVNDSTRKELGENQPKSEVIVFVSSRRRRRFLFSEEKFSQRRRSMCVCDERCNGHRYDSRQHECYHE